MKEVIGVIGFILVIGGAGSSDCGAALLQSVITSLIGLGLMFYVAKKGEKRC